jgi:hypothetical protein
MTILTPPAQTGQRQGFSGVRPVARTRRREAPERRDGSAVAGSGRRVGGGGAERAEGFRRQRRCDKDGCGRFRDGNVCRLQRRRHAGERAVRRAAAHRLMIAWVRMLGRHRTIGRRCRGRGRRSHREREDQENGQDQSCHAFSLTLPCVPINQSSQTDRPGVGPQSPCMTYHTPGDQFVTAGGLVTPREHPGPCSGNIEPMRRQYWPRGTAMH